MNLDTLRYSCLDLGHIHFPTLTTTNYEDECKKTITKDIPGISLDKVKVDTKWVNRTKKLYLVITVDEGEEEPYKDEYFVDTEIYDKYSWEVVDGRLTITLYEIINEMPKFELI